MCGSRVRTLWAVGTPRVFVGVRAPTSAARPVELAQFDCGEARALSRVPELHPTNQLSVHPFEGAPLWARESVVPLDESCFWSCNIFFILIFFKGSKQFVSFFKDWAI